MMGQGAPGAETCSPGVCYMQPIPSGTNAGDKTRILGSSSVSPAKLWGTAGVSRIINLDGSANVEIGNLEITDQSDCVYSHTQVVAACPATGTGQWARMGVYARASSNVWMHDVNVHGNGHSGFHAGGLRDWTLERVKINKNGRAGWDGNVGTTGSVSSNSGQITMRGIEIGWNGCGERVATGEPWACWGSQSGGYGDGFGTYYTAGTWLIEDAFVHHNTSDGLDFRFLDGANNTHITLRRIHSVANAGNQLKVRGNSLIENSVLVGHCSFFKGKYYMLDADLCRAAGSSLLLAMTGGDVAIVRHNTIAGEGDAQIAYTEGDSTDEIYIQNNTVVGFPYFRNPSVFTAMTGGGAPGAKFISDNLGWNARNCSVNNTCDQDPKLTDMALGTFDAEPLSASPVIDKVQPLADVTTDFLLQTRPYGPASDIGAFEVQAPPLNCTRAAPTVSLSGPTAAVPAGSTVVYTVDLQNNDSAACASTGFTLAGSVPDGWTGTLADNSLSLAPGASGSTTLSVTSASTAPAAGYGIGVGVSSSVGAVHTASASTTYTVAAPATFMETTVGTNKATYARGETVQLFAFVRNNGLPVNGAAVTFTIARSTGNTTTRSATSGTDGYARTTYKIAKSSNAIGTYTVRSTWSMNNVSSSAETTFTVL